MVARRALMETEARKLARTGAHSGWQTIQMALVAQGFEEAPKVLPISGRALSWTGYASERGSQHGQAAARRETRDNVEHSGPRVKPAKSLPSTRPGASA